MAEGRGERTIGSGHLVALFLGIVVLCCVFFILGYEMGRAQFEKGGAAAAGKAATPAPSAAAQPAAAAPAPGWPSANPVTQAPAGKPASTAPAASAAPAASKPAASAKNIEPSLRAPEIPQGSIVLQVAANRSQSDALGLAKLLQDKGYPAFVLTPAGDDWYRVQVGPFSDAKSADQAKTGLAKEGFKAIVKR